MYFRPFFWLSFASLPSLAILIMLGVWQLDRLAWKTELIDRFNQRAEARPAPPPIKGADLAQMEFQNLALVGRFFHDQEIYLNGKTYEGNAGFHVITPFQTEEGLVILVNRGWVSEKYRLPESRPFSVSDEILPIKGILRLPQKKGYFVPENEPARGFWFTIMPDEIADYLKIDGVITSYYVDQLRTAEKITLPIAGKARIDVRNAHLNYALTWFGIALSLIGVYLAYHINEGRLGITKPKK